VDLDGDAAAVVGDADRAVVVELHTDGVENVWCPTMLVDGVIEDLAEDLDERRDYSQLALLHLLGVSVVDPFLGGLQGGRTGVHASPLADVLDFVKHLVRLGDLFCHSQVCPRCKYIT